MPLPRTPDDTAQMAEDLMARYGAEAEAIAAAQAETMLELNDEEACDAWKAVMAAIRARQDDGFQAAG